MSGVTTKLGRLRPWGMFRSMVVGLQYGEVKDAEIFHWAREPSNKFDANAISVHDEDGKRLGFLPSKTAAIVSPLVDKQLVDVQLGPCPFPERTSFHLPVRVYLYSEPQHSRTVTNHFFGHGLRVAGIDKDTDELATFEIVSDGNILYHE